MAKKKVVKVLDVNGWAELQQTDEPEIRRLKTEIRRQHKLINKHRGGAELIVDAVREVYVEPPDLALPAKRKRDRRTTVVVEEAWLHLSDTQIGKRTDTYSTAVCADRLDILVDKVERITETRRASAKVDVCHLLLGGDMVEGETIFGGQAWEVDSDLFDQAVRLGPAMVARVVLRLAEIYPEVHIAAVAGNHGRSGGKYSGVSKRTNWDRVLYEITKLIVMGATGDKRERELRKRITWDIAESFYTVQDVAGWGVLGVHGDQIRGGFAGFPFYGAAKKAWGWIDSIDQPWTYLAFGHFHTFTFGTLNKRYYLANGTTESSNVFAQEQLAACGDPCQRLAFFNREHGLVADHQVILATSRKPDYEAK